MAVFLLVSVMNSNSRTICTKIVLSPALREKFYQLMRGWRLRRLSPLFLCEIHCAAGVLLIPASCISHVQKSVLQFFKENAKSTQLLQLMQEPKGRE